MQRFSVEELRLLVASGDMLLPSVATCYMALDVLRERKLVS